MTWINIRGSIKKYVDNVPIYFIFSTNINISTLLFVKTYSYFMCKVSLHLIKRWSSYLNFKYTCIVVTAHPHQHFNVKTRRHGNLCFTAFQSTPLCISHKVTLIIRCSQIFYHVIQLSLSGRP